MATITGRCNCGKYEYTVPVPTDMNLCHCTNCRAWSGAMYSAHVVAKDAEIQTTSPPPTKFVMKGESGREIERAFCSECGCGVWIKSPYVPDLTFMKAGIFPVGSLPKPTQENWLKNKESWESLVEGTNHTSQVQ